jgi:hypothetical protein
MTQAAAPQQVSIHPRTYAELEYMVRLHKEYGAPCAVDSVEDLVFLVLRAVSDGSRRPGSWERGLLESMGLVADTDLHHVYRSNYGPEASIGEVDE